MIGQERLRRAIGSMDPFPRASMFIGERGCGKHTLARETAGNLGMEAEDLTESASLEAFDAIASCPFPRAYLLNLSEMDERRQNILLKFVEEPPAGAYVMLMCEAKERVIPTLLNRCVQFEFAPYSKEEIAYFLPPEAADACMWISTPGQAKEVDWKSVGAMKALCSNVVSNLGKANLPNALRIADRLNHGKDFAKFDPRMFFRMLASELLDAYAGGDDSAGRMLGRLSSEAKPLNDRRISTGALSRHIILSMWEAARDA